MVCKENHSGGPNTSGDEAATRGHAAKPGPLQEAASSANMPLVLVFIVKHQK
jgi:hypothetical protein